MSNSLEQLKKRDSRVFHYEINGDDLVSESCCPMCGSDRLEVLSDVTVSGGPRFFETSVCQTCHFVFRSIFPGFEWFQARWAQIATQSRDVFNPALEDDRKVRYGAYRDLLSPYTVPGGRTLDIGGGYGTGVSVFRDAGYQVELLEPEDDRADYAENVLGIDTHHTVLEEFEPDGQYDLILWAHNLEHVDGPRKSFEKVASMLKPDTGVLYLEVPLARNIIDWSDSMFMAHKSNFSDRHIDDLLAAGGLSQVYKWYPNLNSPVHADIGVIAVPPALAEMNLEKVDSDDQTHTSPTPQEFRDLYQRMMPCCLPDPAPPTLHFEVPFINQFYTTVRYNDGGFTYDSENGRVIFEPAKDAG